MTNATGIDGGNIVGHYRDADGNRRCFVAAIPKPATLSLVSMGGLGVECCDTPPRTGTCPYPLGLV